MIGPVHKSFVLALVAPAVLLLGCGGHSTSGPRAAAPTPTTPDATRAQALPADYRCVPGQGVRPTGRAGTAFDASGPMSDGSTLIASSEIYPGKPSATLRAVTRECADDRAFGSTGTVTIRVPVLASRIPKGVLIPGDGDTLWIEAIAPKRGGGEIIGGTFGGQWVIAALTATGTMDPAFGVRGWSVLRIPGEIADIVQEATGRIILAGDNLDAECCKRLWAAAVSSHGRLDLGYGKRGRAELPTGGDSAVTSLKLARDGDVNVKVNWGSMGCYGNASAVVKPSGHVVISRVHNC